MKFTISTEIWAGILLACTGVNAAADLKDNPYRVILDRNPFGLRPIPLEKVIEPISALPVPAVEIWLTGVTTLLNGSPLAFLEFFDPQTKKSDRPSPYREGDRYNERIQIVSIDALRGFVRINRDGSDVTLDFEKNGIKEGSTRPPVAPPHIPPANVPPPISASRLIVNDRQPATAPAMTPQEALARLHAQRLLHQQQNPSAANMVPPPPVGRTP